VTGRVTINGTSADDSLTGSRFQDFINGGSGADALAGGLGNDSYILRDVHRTDPTLPLFAYDEVTEAAGEGIDTVYVQRAGISSPLNTSAPLPVLVTKIGRPTPRPGGPGV
jgi:Ca2+-binding RTX toxin-like protein